MLGTEAQMLVRGGRGALRPTAADRARNLMALRAWLPAPSLVRTEAPAWTAVGSGAPTLPTLSALAVGLAIGATAAFFVLRAPGRLELTPPSTVAAAVKPTGTIAPSDSLAAVAPRLDAEASASDGSASRAPEVNAPPPRAPDRLADEVAILTQAEREFHRSNYASALRRLDEHARLFPRGILKQERIAARAQTLCRLGRRPEAESALRRLAPGSLQAARAREVCTTKDGR